MSDTFNGVNYRPGFVKADYSRGIKNNLKSGPEVKLKGRQAISQNMETPEDNLMLSMPGRNITVLGQAITPESIAILPEMLSLKDASEKTNLSRDFLRYLIDKGDVKYIRSGNKFFINSFSLAEYLNNAMGNEVE